MRILLAAALVPWVACQAEPAPAAPPRALDGVAELDQPLSDLSSQCSYAAGTGALTLALVAGDVAMLSRLASGAIAVNGIACGAATATNVRQLTIRGDAGDQTVILDYSAGVFGRGSAAGVGTAIDLGAGTDTVKLVGTNGADRFTAGTAGLALDADAYLDVTAAQVEVLVVNLDDGNDTFSGMGSAVTGAPCAQALAIYGAGGDDVLTGGAGDDQLYGGAGDDVLRAGATGDGADLLSGGDGNDRIYGGAGNDLLIGGPGDDLLSGDAGDDDFAMGAAAAGNDRILGGAGLDTVDYGARTGALVVVMDGVTPGGEAGEATAIGADVERLRGGAGDDDLTGNALDNLLEGGGGDDHLRGLAGDDVLDGGIGADTLDCGSGQGDIDLDPSDLGAGCER